MSPPSVRLWHGFPTGEAAAAHLCRLHNFGNEEEWSPAFFTYSNEKYSPCCFGSGTFFGTLEEAFDIGAMYLQD